MAKNKIYRKVADFVICDRTIKIHSVIELDGASHKMTARQVSDKDKEAALTAAGIRLIRIQTGNIPKGDEIRKISRDRKLHVGGKNLPRRQKK